MVFETIESYIVSNDENNIAQIKRQWFFKYLVLNFKYIL